MGPRAENPPPSAGLILNESALIDLAAGLGLHGLESGWAWRPTEGLEPCPEMANNVRHAPAVL